MDPPTVLALEVLSLAGQADCPRNSDTLFAGFFEERAHALCANDRFGAIE
jgi:hypothetical protein